MLGIITVIVVVVYMFASFQSGELAQGLAVPVGLIGFIVALSLFAYGDLLKLLMDVEANTRRTAELLSKRNDTPSS
ncbi:hypothetical protein IT157_08895 [bacterium]|nr:hypothetical protein [bacterium]